ncbi:MAG: RICIN domain-containing protein [Clostridia bacterium]|nr:RICIN domain-containing protein [Clostridia bacterium]
MKRNMKQKQRFLLTLTLCASMLLSMMAFPAAMQDMAEQNQEEALSKNLEAITTEGVMNTGTATETPITEGEITESEIPSVAASPYTLNVPLQNSAYYGTAITSDYKSLLSDPISDGCVYSFVNAGTGMYATTTTASAFSSYIFNLYQIDEHTSPAQAFRLQATDNGYYRILALELNQSSTRHLCIIKSNIQDSEGNYIANGTANIRYHNYSDTTATAYDFEWRFERVEGQEDAYRIFLGDTNYVMTAVDNHVGHHNQSSVAGSGSVGNIIVAPLNVMNERQIWHLESGGQRMHYGINLRETHSTTTNGIYAEIASVTANPPHFSYPVTEYGYTSSVASTASLCTIDGDSALSIERDAGRTYIRGSEFDSSETQKSYHSLSCYIYLPRWMYYITTPDGAYVLGNNTPVTDTSYYHGLVLFPHGGGEPTNHMQLFEFTYIGQGKYVISLMDYEHIVWYRASNSLYAYPTTIPDDYIDLPSNKKWMLATDSNGFYIYNDSITYTLTAPDTISSGSLPTLSSFMFEEKQYWNITKANFLSGYELISETEKWNNFISIDLPSIGLWDIVYDVKDYNNCYSYMLNHLSISLNEYRFKMQPGQYDGTKNNFNNNYGYFDIELLIDGVNADSSIANFIFSPIGQYDICPAGTYKVALIYGQNDYHWYRQNADGTWSHKPGNDIATNFDQNEEIITDPLYATHSSAYAFFYGYFYVSSPNREPFIWFQ